ncbi:hypothetical protein FO519_008623 [Halicephalobus sp. NKZ332]|nr:hypothetical protein FO519_008623 [Halicephalobus sp. NKZ332]
MILYHLMMSLILYITVLKTVSSLPVLSNALNAEFEYPQIEFGFPPDMDKRDLEEVMLPEIPERFALLMQLPRTDRKTLEEFYDQELPSEDIEISARSIFPKIEAPSQKEVTGPIVVGPQTKSTQTSSAKKP